MVEKKEKPSWQPDKGRISWAALGIALFEALKAIVQYLGNGGPL